ncbi:hypothetical protein UAW_02793 [Enterococcus haemoperoxidus ATCC BAA-382]|uniref:Uncharacterized protein n=1 Tax=Enterococcus haemoperoxidus ATCC BAA-382 TaxID=1158608 RepID=R2SXG3_9ENTE|nr:glycosyltransferase family 39 protein [Enterococcus haemoperoxidus]EOH92754.1 hypothetical protein UAW_02793 [Enterococcus haemoperoxidus ATCC BAA-382]EOT61497.1 hypothetical protein I583_00477 [Enterococcus haemoperoxidus ATCC BAA-382]
MDLKNKQIKEQYEHNRTIKFISLLLIFFSFVIVVFSFRSNPFSHLLNGHDSSMFIYFGRGIKDGFVPYNDMFDHKGIFLFIFQYLGIVLGFGNDSLGIWILECLFYGLSLIYIYKILMYFIKDTIVSSTTIVLYTGIILSSFDFGNYSEEFALPFITISLYLFAKIWLETTNSSWNLFFIGICGGITFFIRPNMIALWIVFCLLLLIRNVFKKEYSVLRKQILYIFMGGMLICLTVLVYSLINENLKEMVYQTFILNVQYSSSSVGEKILTAKSFFQFMTDYGILAFMFPFITLLIVNPQNLQKKFRVFYVILFIYLLVNFFTVIMSGRFYTHYFITMFPGLILATGIGFDWCLRQFDLALNKKIICILLLFVLTLSHSESAFKDYVKQTNNNIPNEKIDSLVAKEAEYIKMHSTKSDRIYVHNISASIYNISDRYSNSKFFKLPSLDYLKFRNLKEEFTDKLYENPPKFIVVGRQTYLNKETLTDTKLDKTVVTAVKENYQVIPEYEETDYMVFQLKSSN